MTTFDSSFFRAEISHPVQTSPRHWRAKATIYRKDSDERVESFSVRDSDPNMVQKRVTEVVEQKLYSMEKPGDWGRDPIVAKVIDSYFELRDELYGLFLQAQEAPSKETAVQITHDAGAYERMRMKSLKTQIEHLTEHQKMQLVSPTESEEKRPDDPWVLDILTAKKVLYPLIEQPSPSLRDAYQRVMDALNSEQSPDSNATNRPD